MGSQYSFSCRLAPSRRGVTAWIDLRRFSARWRSWRPQRQFEPWCLLVIPPWPGWNDRQRSPEAAILRNPYRGGASAALQACSAMNERMNERKYEDVPATSILSESRAYQPISSSLLNEIVFFLNCVLDCVSSLTPSYLSLKPGVEVVLVPTCEKIHDRFRQSGSTQMWIGVLGNTAVFKMKTSKTVKSR